MSETIQLSGLQMAVMRVLWDHGEATTATIHECIQAERDLAFTTVSTVISRLAKKGIVTHRSEGRQYVYRPLVSEEAVRRSMVADLVERLFEGNATALVSHLLTESEMADDELERLRALVAGADTPSEPDATDRTDD